MSTRPAPKASPTSSASSPVGWTVRHNAEVSMTNSASRSSGLLMVQSPGSVMAEFVQTDGAFRATIGRSARGLRRTVRTPPTPIH